MSVGIWSGSGEELESASRMDACREGGPLNSLVKFNPANSADAGDEVFPTDSIAVFTHIALPAAWHLPPSPDRQYLNTISARVNAGEDKRIVSR